jgi:hypothetical protein
MVEAFERWMRWNVCTSERLNVGRWRGAVADRGGEMEERRETGDGGRGKSGRMEGGSVWRLAIGGLRLAISSWRLASTSCHELSRWPN